jgi:multiple sugar transport system substrate-binding protein
MRIHLLKKAGTVCFALLLVVSLLLSACENGGNKPGSDGTSGQNAGTGGKNAESVGKDEGGAKVSTKPVTLKVLVRIGLADKDFDRYIVQPAKKLHPNITLERMELPKGKKLEEWVASGDIPDLILQGANVADLFDLKLPLDLNPLLKQANIDLARYDAEVMNTIKQYGDKNQIYALPFKANTLVLFYNKGLFDKFGAAYPKDGMTWDQTIELARKLTKSEGGTQYKGLDVLPGSITGFASPLSLPLYDAKSGKAVVSDQWKNVFDTAMSAYSIPGNKPDQLKAWASRDFFLKDKNLAMTNDYINFMFAQFINKPDIIDWDIAQLPSFQGAPNKTNQTDFHQFFVTTASKHPAEALEVIKAATSDEVQLALAKSGSLPVLTNKEIQKQFGADLPFKGKHMEGIFKSTAAKKQFSDYDVIVEKAISSAFADVFNGKTDTNTALRTAEEQANKAIEQQKQTK